MILDKRRLIYYKMTSVDWRSKFIAYFNVELYDSLNYEEAYNYLIRTSGKPLKIENIILRAARRGYLPFIQYYWNSYTRQSLTDELLIIFIMRKDIQCLRFMIESMSEALDASEVPHIMYYSGVYLSSLHNMSSASRNDIITSCVNNILQL